MRHLHVVDKPDTTKRSESGETALFVAVGVVGVAMTVGSLYGCFALVERLLT